MSPFRRALVPLVLTATLLLPVRPALASPTSTVADTVDVTDRSTTGRTFFVDPLAGSDRASGRSGATAWRTLAQVERAGLRAGDTVRLRAGRRHVGGLLLTVDGTRARPVTVTRYGKGSRPVLSSSGCVTIRGDWTRVTGIAAVGCGRAGFTIEGAHDTLRDVFASGNVAGVWIRPGSSYAVVAGSVLRKNDRMADGTPGPDDDYGAFGVEVNGDHARVTGNRISGNVARSADYGQDGSAVEVYQAVGTTIDRNVSVDNHAFTELGGSRSSGTRITRNTVRSSLRDSSFLVTRGPGQVWGPVRRTLADRNDVHLTGSRSFGFGCYGGCTRRILTLRRNTLVAGWYAGYVEGTFGSSHNVYGGEIWFPLQPTDTRARLAR